MATFELEEAHSVLGALEKKSSRQYTFKGLPGQDESDNPRLVVSDGGKILREVAQDDLLKLKKIGNSAYKIYFSEESTGIKKMVGRRNFIVRTIRFRDEDAEISRAFALACRSFNPAIEIEKGGDEFSDIESKSSNDFVRDSMDTRKEPQGSLDLLNNDRQAQSSTLIEHLGSGGGGTDSTTFNSENQTGSLGRFDVGEEEEMMVVTIPLPTSTNPLLQTVQYNDLRKEVCAWPKYFGRMKNRFGMAEAKTIAVGEEEIRIISMENEMISESGAPSTAATTAQNEDAEEEVPLSQILAQGRETIRETTAAPITSNNNNTTIVMKTSFVNIPKNQISKLILYGVWGKISLIKLESGIEFELSFENCGSRNHFAKTIFGTIRDPRVVQMFPGGEDCALADTQGPWNEYAIVALKAMGSVRTSRFFILNRLDKSVWIFRNSDLNNSLVTDGCIPFRAIGVPQTGISIEQVKSSRGRLKWGWTNSSLIISSATSSASLASTTKADVGEKTHFDVLFPNYFERERFCANLNSFVSQVKYTGTPSQLRAKYQRKAWFNPNLSWFEVRRGLFVGTFNVGDAPPPDPATLDLWVQHPSKVRRDVMTGMKSAPAGRTRAKSGSAGVTGRFSMYVFGLQECGNKFDDWTKALQNHLGGDFALVSSIRLWEIGLLVFTSLSEVSKISNIETSTVATGRGIAKEVTGVQLGNKGGVGIGLRWRDTSLCFINAHLAPHQEKSQIRNQNFSQIMNKLGLFGSAGDCGEIGFEPTHAFEHVFFFGDLNYRVDESFQKVISISSTGNWKKLHEMDQLKKEMESGRAYVGFREVGVPDFPPTYRWERNKRAFSNKKDQPPSYTDRVLLHSRNGFESKITPLLYGSSQDVMISDHRPVASTFSISLREPLTLWPIHPLVAEIQRKDAFDEMTLESAGIGREESGSSVDENGSMSSSSSPARPQSQLRSSYYNPLEQLPLNNDSVSDRDANLLDEDEEDCPEQFLGPVGNFFVTPESFQKESNCSPPELRLSELVLKLDRKDDKNPPTFVQLRIGSKILQEVETCEPSAGMDGDGDKADYAFAADGDKQKVYNSLYYSWYKRDGHLTLKPITWDPCYLTTQSLLIAVEEISASRKKEEAKKKASVLDESMMDDTDSAPTSNSQRKTLSSGIESSSSRISQKLARRKKSVGSTAMQIGAVIVGSAAHSLSGQVCLSLAPIITELRRKIEKDIGLGDWTRDRPFSLKFSERVVLSGVCVGNLEGKLTLIPGDYELQMQSLIDNRPSIINRLSSRHAEQLFCLKSYDVEVQLEGFNDKRGTAWRRVFFALNDHGILYICSKNPGTKSGHAFVELINRSALVIIDTSEGSIDLSIGMANVADRASTFEIRGRKIFSCSYDTAATNPKFSMAVAVKDETEKKYFVSCLQSYQMTLKYEKELIQQVKRDIEGRKEQRVRRVAIEKKRRQDLESKLLARQVQFEEVPPPPPLPSSTTSPSTPEKHSFIARALKKTSGKGNTTEDFDKMSLRGRWFGSPSSPSIKKEEGGDDDQKPRSVSNGLSPDDIPPVSSDSTKKTQEERLGLSDNAEGGSDNEEKRKKNSINAKLKERAKNVKLKMKSGSASFD